MFVVQRGKGIRKERQSTHGIVSVPKEPQMFIPEPLTIACSLARACLPVFQPLALLLCKHDVFRASRLSGACEKSTPDLHTFLHYAKSQYLGGGN